MELSVEYKAKNVGLGFDHLIYEVLGNYGAERTSGGCCMFGDAVRDMQFDICPQYAEDAIAALEELGKQHPDVCLSVGEV